MISNKLQKRLSDIAHNRNADASDEYYTLYHAFSAAFLELLCRYHKGIRYKVIICPCDSLTSVFRELDHLKHLIGDPRVIYSYWPEKDWAEYFEQDWQEEYRCDAKEVCIFTNPPFKGLHRAFRAIKCDYILFGAISTGVMPDCFCKETGGFRYIKNNDSYTGNADEFNTIYGDVPTCFFSNIPFLSYGPQYQNQQDKWVSIMFGKDKLTRIDKQKKVTA